MFVRLQDGGALLNLLDRLLGHAIHARVMDDIDARYGRKVDAYYHIIFGAFMNDLHAR